MQVDVLTGGGAGVQYDEDDPHTTGDTGNLFLAVRADTAATTTSLDGDYAPLLTDANGRLHVLDPSTAAIKTAVEVIDNAVAVDGAAYGSGVLVQGDDGTDRRAILVDAAGHLQVDIIAGGGTGGTSETDDSAFTPATTAFTPVGGIYRSSRDSVDDNDMGALAMTASRALIATLETPSGDSLVNDTTNRVMVSVDNTPAIGTITPGITATSLGKGEDVAFASGDVGVMALAVRSDTAAATSVTNGDYMPLIVNSTGCLHTILAANSGVVIGDVNLGATDNAVLDAIAASLVTIASEYTATTIKRFNVIATGSGNTVLIAAVGAKKFRLRSLSLVATSATAVSLYLHTTTDTNVLGDSTNKLTLDLDGGGGPAGVVLQHNPDGWVETSTANEALNINLSAATPVVVIGTYIEVD